MKVKVAVLIGKLEESKQVYLATIVQKKEEHKKKQAEEEKRVKESFKAYIKGTIQYHKDVAALYENIKTVEEWRALKHPQAPVIDQRYYNYGGNWDQEERNIKQIDSLIAKLKLSAEEVISVRDSDNYFYYIKF